MREVSETGDYSIFADRRGYSLLERRDCQGFVGRAPV